MMLELCDKNMPKCRAFCYCCGAGWQVFTATEERSVCQEVPQSRQKLRCYQSKRSFKFYPMTQRLSSVSREMEMTREEIFAEKNHGGRNGKREGLKVKY